MAETLQNFGVPLQGGGGRGMMRQPKLKNRFRVTLINFGFRGEETSPITLETNSCGLPTLSMDKGMVNAYMSKAHFLGGVTTWSDIELVVRDTIDNGVKTLVAHQWQRQMDTYNQTGPGAATDYKFRMEVEELDGSDQGVYAKWVFEGASVMSLNFGGLDYSSTDAQTISMTIPYDNGILYDGAGNLIMASNPTPGFGTSL